MSRLGYFTSARAFRAGRTALMLDLVAKAWCDDNGTDVVPRAALGFLGGIAGLVGNDVNIAAQNLTESGIWRNHVDGYVIEVAD